MRDYNYALDLKDNDNEHIIRFDDYVDNEQNNANVKDNVSPSYENKDRDLSYAPKAPDVTEVVLPKSLKEQNNVHYDYVKQHDLRIIKVLLEDVAKNIFTYFLIVIFTALCLYKIHQVQETRDITSHFNQVITDNDNLHKKWLSLIAQRQELSEHAKIRKAALEKLHMVAPKTDSELVINLYNVK